MKKNKTQTHKNKEKLLSKNSKLLHYYFGFVLVAFLTFGPFLFYNLSYQGKIFPNIFVDGIYLGGQTLDQARSTLTQDFDHPEKIVLRYEEKVFDFKVDDLEISYDLNRSIERAYSYPRTGNPFYDTINRIKLLKYPVHLGLGFSINEQKLSSLLDPITKTINIDPIHPSVKVVGTEIVVDKGKEGKVVDNEKLREQIGFSLASASSSQIDIPITQIDPTLNDSEVELAKKRGESYLGKTLTLKFEYSEFTYKGNDLLKLVDPKDGFNDQAVSEVVYKIASEVNRPSQNPKFQFDGARVTEFVPALDGISINSNKLKEELIQKLTAIEQNSDKVVVIEIPVTRTKPSVTTDKVNNLGIKELIGRGTSTYFHSIPGRVYNVNLAASRINGSLIAPGETFSFTGTLGDVSKETGYKEAYVISGGRTILGDGGGVCQVSTTLFRAVLNAGLPVNERVSHAYRVGYYEQDSPPGFDATIYYPRPDFKFTNDTNNHILIVAKNDPKKYSLVFELYGTSDGRTSVISKPVTTNVRPALPTVYQDDPTLPVGTTKQVDYAASGAKVSFNYTVNRNGQEIYNKTFVSNYQPWAAVYLRGTKTQ